MAALAFAFLSLFGRDGVVNRQGAEDAKLPEINFRIVAFRGGLAVKPLLGPRRSSATASF
jgi:hypothetical protein